MDALTHAIEAYVSTKSSDYTDALAEKTVQLIFKYLLRAYKNGNDMIAREKLHNASCMAGMAFTNAALGINHSIAHTVGGNFHISHGRANAIILTSIIKYNAEIDDIKNNKTSKKYAELSKILGFPCSSVKEGVNSLICAINILIEKTNTPKNFEDMNVDRDKYFKAIDFMATSALEDICTITNPKKVNKKDMIDILKKVYENNL